MAKKNHNYIGNGKQKTFANGGSVVNGSICLDDIINITELESKGVDLSEILAIPVAAIDIAKTNGKRYLNLTISEKPEPSSWGDTHSIYIEEFYMEREGRGSSRPTNPPAAAPPPAADPFGLEDDDDVPF